MANRLSLELYHQLRTAHEALLWLQDHSREEIPADLVSRLLDAQLELVERYNQ
jgi:hypothetical protein